MTNPNPCRTLSACGASYVLAGKVGIVTGACPSDRAAVTVDP
jgi:hypothetical protein